MEQLQRQVLRARRRLIAQQFLRIVGWWSFAALTVSAAALAVPKIWIMEFDTTESMVWVTSWLCGTLAVAFVAAVACAWWVRRGVLEAAIEIDRRFNLRERVSSSLTLGPQERESEVGRALIGDASRRVQRIDVGSEFRFRPTWRLLLPLLPGIAVLVLVFGVQDAAQAKPDPAGPKPIDITKRIKNTAVTLQPQIARRKKEAEELGLKDAADLFDRLERGVEKMQGEGGLDRKKAAIKLNEISKELKQRREALGGADQMKKQLNQLGNIKSGPADRMADAIKKGEFGKAKEELEALKEKLEKDDLTEEEKKQLEEQMNDVREEVQEMVNAHKEAQNQLEEQIRQQEAQGNMEQVAKLQQQLDELNQQQQQMQQMQQLADQLGNCADCLQGGNLQDAAAQLDQIGEGLDGLQQQIDELEMLDDMLDQLADAKDAMNCPDCQGGGCKACQGGGNGKGDGPPGVGMGEGQGHGARPEADEGNEKFYDSRVRIPPGPGAAAIVGRVDGPNMPGQAREAIKAEIESSRRESARPVLDQKMPRPQREHAQQYFDNFREGKN
jgi:hypothetical protein